MRRQKQESVMRYLLAFMLATCLVPIILALFVHDDITPVEEPTETTVTMTDITTTTTTEVTTTTTTTTTVTESTTSFSTTLESTTSTSVTTMTEKLLTYEILQRIDVINVLLDNSNYERLVKKNPESLTSDERVELYYYSGLVLERKTLKEYLEKNK